MCIVRGAAALYMFHLYAAAVCVNKSGLYLYKLQTVRARYYWSYAIAFLFSWSESHTHRIMCDTSAIKYMKPHTMLCSLGEGRSGIKAMRTYDRGWTFKILLAHMRSKHERTSKTYIGELVMFTNFYCLGNLGKCARGWWICSGCSWWYIASMYPK